ncbi:DNA-directed RNA polymerase subunit K [Candidatus Pacearchaeota archaeon]|nr:DNA-directed RNA polymerase subunit K [Candidatus Pacearchaeota archaeon]
MKNEQTFTKYEKARILGARALQIAMNAPLLIKIKKEDLEKINYNALKIAEIEFESNALPISIKRPFPEKKEEKLKRAKETKVSDEKLEEMETKEEQEIVKEGEIMELATPEDEVEDDASSDDEGDA